MIDYIKKLRKYMGQQPIMQCAASMIVYDEYKGILLQKRVDNGLWCYHGGAVELGEETSVTAERELCEETGLRAVQFQLFGVYSGKELYYQYPNGDEVFIVDVVYICTEYTGELMCDPKEVSELRWFAIDDLPKNIMPPIKKPLAEFIETFKK